MSLMLCLMSFWGNAEGIVIEPIEQVHHRGQRRRAQLEFTGMDILEDVAVAMVIIKIPLAVGAKPNHQWPLTSRPFLLERTDVNPRATAS